MITTDYMGEGGVEWRPSELKEPTNKQTYPRRSGVIIRVLQKQRGEQLEVKVFNSER